MLQALFLLGGVVHQPIHLTQIVVNDHDESNTISTAWGIFFAAAALKSRPIFKDQLIQKYSFLDRAFLLVLTTTQGLEMLCQS